MEVYTCEKSYRIHVMLCSVVFNVLTVYGARQRSHVQESKAGEKLGHKIKNYALVAMISETNLMTLHCSQGCKITVCFSITSSRSLFKT